MFRPTDTVIVDTVGSWEANDPIVPYGVFAVNSDGSGVKVGNGSTTWSNLVYLGSNTIGGYPIDTLHTPVNNDIIVYSDSATKFVYRLQGIIDTADNWESTNSIFPTFAVLIETDEYATLTGRIKISDGVTNSNNIEWLGFNFDDWPTNYSLIFNGTTIDYALQQPYNQLPFATTPVGKVCLDDGTWGYPTIINPIYDIITDLLEADQAYIFGTITLGGYPTEATSVTLTTDGTYLYIDDQKVWTAYNDGHGSGLDADTLDGYHFTAFGTVPTTVTTGDFVAFGAFPTSLVDSGYDFASFLGVNDKAVDSNLLDGYDSTYFASTGDITTVEDTALVYSIVFGG